MTELKKIPVDHTTTIEQLIDNPYPIYKKYRQETPVIRVESVKRILITKAKDSRYVKDHPEIFSSNDPLTPMKPAFQSHTLMRKDGAEHLRERHAMAETFSPKTIRNIWVPTLSVIADEYINGLPEGENVDLFQDFAGPIAARCLVHLLGLEGASDQEMMYWSQTLINGAGNFGWEPKLFKLCDEVNKEINSCIDKNIVRLQKHPDKSALSVMINSDDPIPMSQILGSLKVAIAGGLNEPRDALCTIVYGLLTNRDQLEAIYQDEKLWGIAFEEGIRWVAPIQAVSRVALEDADIGGYYIPKGDTVMTIMASANHDEDVYDEPEKYNIFRQKKPHQAFGNGPHFCQGSHLARSLLPKIILPKLFARFPNMSLADPDSVIWQGFGFRGPINLPVTLRS